MSIKRPDVIVLSEYHKNLEKVSCLCKNCGHKWDSTPNHLLRKKMCPRCSIQNRIKHQYYSNDEFLKKLSIVNNLVTPLETYVNSKTRLLCRCEKCLTEWTAIPNHLLKGIGCPVCGGAKRKTTDEFIQELKEKDIDITLLEGYKNGKTNIRYICNSCSHVYNKPPFNILQYQYYPACTKHSSIGERKIRNYLSQHLINFVEQQSFRNLVGIGGKKLRFDFYIEDYNTLIEFQGIQHYEPIKYFGDVDRFLCSQEHDRRKSKYAKQHGVNLLCIRYDENVEEVLDLWFRTHKPKPWIKIKYISKLESVETAGQAWQQAC